MESCRSRRKEEGGGIDKEEGDDDDWVLLRPGQLETGEVSDLGGEKEDETEPVFLSCFEGAEDFLMVLT